MPTRKSSVSSSKTLSETPKRARRSRVASDVISGLKDAVAFSRGTLSLHVRTVDVPNPVDVRALRSKLGLSQAEFAGLVELVYLAFGSPRSMESAREPSRNGSRAARGQTVPCALT